VASGGLNRFIGPSPVEAFRFAAGSEELVIRNSIIKRAAAAAVAALGLFSTRTALAGDVSIGINIGSAPPPPPPVVVEYDTYCVGYRANLYDADWRLRNAQAEQWRAERDLDAARRHEGEVADILDDREG
jgi:hypothetical protein